MKVNRYVLKKTFVKLFKEELEKKEMKVKERVAEDILDAFFRVLYRCLLMGKRVRLWGIGALRLRRYLIRRRRAYDTYTVIFAKKVHCPELIHRESFSFILKPNSEFHKVLRRVYGSVEEKQIREDKKLFYRKMKGKL